MKKYTKYIIIISVIFSVISCTYDHITTEDIHPIGPTEIRIKNASNYDYKDVDVSIPGITYNYGDINKGEVTGYKTFEYAYRYAGVHLMIDTSLYRFIPADYVGEKTLGKGKFTYIITVTDTVLSDTVYNNLYIEVEKD